MFADALQQQVVIADTLRTLMGMGAQVFSLGQKSMVFPTGERFEPRTEGEFTILDCPPSLGPLTVNALVAADRVIVPVQAEYFALEGISELLDTMERIRQSFNPGLEVEGVVLTMFDERTNLAQQVAINLREFFGDKLCVTTIPRNVRLAEAPSYGKPALLYDVRSRGAESYIKLAKEIMGKVMSRAAASEAEQLAQQAVVAEQAAS